MCTPQGAQDRFENKSSLRSHALLLHPCTRRVGSVCRHISSGVSRASAWWVLKGPLRLVCEDPREALIAAFRKVDGQLAMMGAWNSGAHSLPSSRESQHAPAGTFPAQIGDIDVDHGSRMMGHQYEGLRQSDAREYEHRHACGCAGQNALRRDSYCNPKW